MSKSGLMKFYKSQGAAQFKLLPPRWKTITTKAGDQRQILDKEGAVLLEVAPGNGDKRNPSWDWGAGSKISFAISFADICQLIETTTELENGRKVNRLRGGGESSARVFHNHDGTPKTLQLEPGVGNYAYTWKLVIAEGKGAARRQIMVPLSDGEHTVIMRVLSGLAGTLVGLD